MTKLRYPHLLLPIAVLTLAPPAIAAEPQFVDWTSIDITTDVAEGTVGTIGVTLSGGPIQSGNVDGTSDLFSGLDFTPPLPTSDVVELASYTIPSVYTISFTQAILDPVFHIGDLSTRITFEGAPPVRLSGSAQFTVTGNSIDGGGVFGASGGTVQLSGSYTSVSFSAVDLIQSPPGGDGFYIQVGVSAVPEPVSFALLLVGLFVVASGARIAARSK